MHSRLFFSLLAIAICVPTQTPAVEVPTPARRYLDILSKRPQPGTIFERFYAAWLEESTAQELGEHLAARAKLPDAKAADHLLLAVFHAHRGDDHSALAAYEAALKLDPSNASAWMERSRLEARALDFAAALQSLDAAVKAQPDAASSMEIGKLRGRALLRLGRNEEALRIWKELAAAHADDEDLSEELVDLLADEGQYEAALETAQALVKRSRDPVARTLRQLRLTDILLQAERRDEALNTLHDTLAATGSDSWLEGDVLSRISRVFRMSDDVEGFEKFLGGLVKEHPQRVALAWQHTQLLGEIGQKDAALKEARALLQSNPGRRDLQEGFLDLLESLELIQEAVAQAQALTQLNAADKEMLVRLASLQHRAKDDAAAQATLERFLKHAGATEADYLRAARLLENWENAPAKPGSPAAQAYVRLVERFPDSISAQEAQAHYLHRAGQRAAALAIWTRLAKSAALEDLLRITQALQARQESRTALDLLAPREQEFAREPRFYALLMQLGIANKEIERALPWARVRLGLTQDAEGIESAVKDILLVLRSDEAGKLSPPLLQELQSQSSTVIQNRCLLAALLENAGKGADAEKTLNAAPAEDKLIALSQLVMLFQTRQEWEKAAQTLQQVIALPGARTTARVQRMVDFYRRADKPEQALTWIAEWKKLSPSAVQPWLDESRLLITLNLTKDALALLRSALKKFPDSVEAASSHATLCVENGQPDEAERTYLALYEKTTDATARLRLISPLALAAQQHNNLPKLVENFQQRQKQNRASAQPWLALAEIHRATGNDEERRRCLYEASRLRPQDLPLLLDIARSEEEIGLTAEALHTLESAAKLDKTTKTRESIARLQIESGDADLGYRMLFEIAGGSQMDARAIEQMADTIAEKGEWERVIAFLEPLLEKHPKDYRLHYLNAVALEEAGREKEAVRAFIEILGMHEELPGVTSTGRSIGIRMQYESMSLPPGTEDWLVLPSMAQAAYIHRQKQGGRANYGSYNTFGSNFSNGLPSNGFVQQAPGVTESPVLALAHVLQLVSLWDVAEREPALRSLRQAGVSDASLLLEAAESSPQLVITTEMLAEHPQNAALHAAWLMQGGDDSPEERQPVYENAFKLFQTSHPPLALRTAAAAWPASGTQASIWGRRILDLCQAQPKPDATAIQTLSSLLRSQSHVPSMQAGNVDAVKMSPEDVRASSDILKRWMHAADGQESYHAAEIIYALAAVQDWEGIVEIVQHRLSLPDKPQNQPPAAPVIFLGQGSRTGSHRNFRPSPLPMASITLKLPPDTLNWISRISAQPDSEESSLSEDQKNWFKEFHAGLQPFIEKARTPELRFALQLLTGQQQALLDEMAPRLASSPALEDLLLAGWLSQQINLFEKALAFFKQARPLATDAAQILQLDLAMLFHAQLLLQQSDKADNPTLIDTIKPALDHLSQTAATQEEKYMLAEILNSFGLQEEAQNLMQAAQRGTARTRSTNVPQVTNPYSRSYSYRQQQKTRVSLDELLKKGDQTDAVQEIVRQLRIAIQGCLNPQNSSSAHHQIHNVINLFTQHKLTDQVMQTMKNAADGGWKTRQEHAVLLEHTGLETKPAIEAHRAVITANPRAFASHERLTVLLAIEGDFQTSLQHWKRLPEVTQALYLSPLIQEFSERSTISRPRPAALSGLLSAWLRSLPAGRPMSAGIIQQFHQTLGSLQSGESGQNVYFPAIWEPATKENSRQSRNRAFNEDGSLKLSPESQKAQAERRAAHDQLCKAMLEVPELAAVGFAPLGGLAMHENRNLPETEKMALDVLSLRAMPKVKRRLMAQGHYQKYGGTDPASPFGGIFATSNRIAMPAPSVFATYSAALRGDQKQLDEVIFPAILKAEGKTIEEYCRAYAMLLMADESHFVSAASDWLKPPGKGNYAHRSQQPGGPLEEIVRLWQKRQIKEPLDSLFLSKPDQPAYSNPGYLPQAVNSYVFALGQRDPEALRRFVRSLRDQSIGGTPELRAQNIAAWREDQEEQQSGVRRYFRPQLSRSLQAVQSYIQWLQNLLQDPRSLPLLTLATEDGLIESNNWLTQIASQHASDRFQAIEDFMQTADALGFLGEPASFRTYVLNKDEQHSTWLGGLAQHYRDRWNDEAVNKALTVLGRRKPTLGSDLAQALLMKNTRTPMQLDGRPVTLEAMQLNPSLLRRDEGAACRAAALRIVLLRHAKDISAMSATGQSELSTLLRLELSGYPHADSLGEELAGVLSPLLKFEAIELTRKIDLMLAAKSWTDLHQQEYQFTQKLPALLHDFASVDTAKADAAARHAVELLRGSPEHKQAMMQNNRETPVYRLLTALLRVPELLNASFALADQEGISQSHGWTSSLRSYMEESLHHPENVRFVFSGTPWVAEAAEYRDPKNDSSQEPTLLAGLITRIENSSELRPLIHDILKKQPVTFGTELLLAFLQRTPGDDTSARSFYDSSRPDASFILGFIQKRHEDFARLKPEAASSLLAMLKARMPDLDQKAEQDATLKQALQPLVAADDAQYRADVSRWMQMTRLEVYQNDLYGVIQTALPLLDRLAQSDKTQAVAFLDQISKLLAQQEALNNRGGRRPQPHQTQVAQWLQHAVTVPEIFSEIMQRAEESGAAGDASWLGNTLGRASNLYKQRGNPRRVVALLEAAGILDPAATFNPWPIPGNSQQTTMLESMSGEFTGGGTHPGLVEELGKRQPRTFGVNLITLLSSKRYNARDEVTAFAQAHVEEIASCSAEQKKLLAGYFQRRKWAEIFAANVPSLQEEFAPIIKEQAAKLQTLFDDLLKAKNWQEIEMIYVKTLSPAQQPRSSADMQLRMRMNGRQTYYRPGERSALDYLGDQLSQTGAADVDKFQQVLKHLGGLYRNEFGQTPDPFPFRKPSLNSFVSKLSGSARLAPRVLQFAAQNIGAPALSEVRVPGEVPLSEYQLITLAMSDASLASEEKIAAVLNELGLLASAESYDAVSLPSFKMHSLLELALWRLSSLNPELAEKTVRHLTGQKEAGFGHCLFAACLTPKESPERNQRLDLCSAHFSRLKLEAAGAVLSVFEAQFPELAKAEQAGAEELSRFAPLLKLRSAEERSFLDAILAGQRGVPTPFRGYTMTVRNELVRLMTNGRQDDALKLVQALSRHLEPEDTSGSFAQKPYFRVGGAVSYFLQSQLRINSEDAPALLACQMLAAAAIPEVRVMSESAYPQNTVPMASEVFQLWEQRGGWASPKAVWSSFMQEVGRHDISSTQGLWLPFLSSALRQMGASERRAVAEWAAEKKEPGLDTIRRECRLALDLVESTEAMSDWPDGPCQPVASSPSASKTLAAATVQARTMLKDEQIKPHVRLVLAAWLTATHPGILDAEARQTWGLAAARAWHDNVPITRFELGVLLNSAAVLPLNDAWRQTSSLALERWDQLEAIVRKARVRYLDSTLHSAIFRLAAGSDNTAALDQFLGNYGKYDLAESTGFLLERGDWQRIGSLKLRSPQSLSTPSGRKHWWLPPKEAVLREMQAAGLEDALLAEVTALMADDTATRMLYPDSQWKPRPARLAAFAKKVASLPLSPEQAVQRAQTLVTLGKEQPESALLLLPQYEAIARVFMPIPLGNTYSDYCWVDFIAVYAALKTASGDFKTADSQLERLRNNPDIIRRHGSSDDYIVGKYRSTLFQCLARLWSAGSARDPEKVLQLAAFSGAQPSSSEYGYLSHALLQIIISAWHQTLQKESLPAGNTEQTLGISHVPEFIELLAAISDGGKQRMPFQQRLDLFARVFAQAKLYSSNPGIWTRLVQHHVFTSDELVKNSDAVLKITRFLAPSHLENYAQFMRDQGMFKAAAQFYALAQEQWSRAKTPSVYYTNRCLLARAEMLIRHGDLEEARRALGQFGAADKNTFDHTRRTALLSLLSPPAPAPAK